jgi:hypothetical protein
VTANIAIFLMSLHLLDMGLKPLVLPPYRNSALTRPREVGATAVPLPRSS